MTPHNPFRSRSTVLALACLVTLLILNGMAWKSGWYNSEFALVSVYIVKEILQALFKHQIEANGSDLPHAEPPQPPHP